MTAAHEAEFELLWQQFLDSPQCVPFSYKNGDIPKGVYLLNEITRRRVDERNGPPALSDFEIAFRDLMREGHLIRLPQATEPPKESLEIAAKIAAYDSGKISTYEFRLQCKQDRNLRDAYERHTGLANLAAPAPQAIPLTAAQYRSIPVRVVQVRYRNEPAFKAAVEALIAAGQI